MEITLIYLKNKNKYEIYSSKIEEFNKKKLKTIIQDIKNNSTILNKDDSYNLFKNKYQNLKEKEFLFEYVWFNKKELSKMNKILNVIFQKHLILYPDKSNYELVILISKKIEQTFNTINTKLILKDIKLM